MIRVGLALCLLAQSAGAEALVATRNIRPKDVITAEDVSVKDITIAGTLTAPEQVIGQEARVVLYAGRPIRQGDIGAPALVERNQVVPLIYAGAALMISTEGRALDRAGAGETIRVMNLSSRSTVSAIITAEGKAHVQ